MHWCVPLVEFARAGESHQSGFDFVDGLAYSLRGDCRNVKHIISLIECSLQDFSRLIGGWIVLFCAHLCHYFVGVLRVSHINYGVRLKERDISSKAGKRVRK